jgi:hypothetical protein
MAIGLNRTKNLSEKNLNLKESLQKLYAPGIEDDIELFSLSSSIESVVISGPEEDSATVKTQIYAIASEKLKQADESVINRTKFLTKFYTYTNDNLVYFDNLNITLGSSTDITPIKYSDGGSVPTTKIIYGGEGFYFLNTDGSVYDAGNSITVKGVTLVGTESSSNSIRADVTLEKTPDAAGNTDYLTNFTPGSIKRYAISSIDITTEGSGYIVPERLSISVDEEVEESGGGTTIVLKKQDGDEFAFTNPIILSDLYYYRVLNAKDDSFFLFDDNLGKYVFLDVNSSSLEIKDIDLRRYDGIKIDNFIPFKFAQSIIYLESYRASNSIGSSISGAINSVASRVSFLNTRKEKAVQNTRRPTPVTSEENILGYSYNSFEGDDVVIWQRVVVRDKDFVLDPSDSEITGSALKNSVDNFRLTKADSSEIPIPGLFIKVGEDYFRAFSTTDKPFLFPNNPNANGVLSAEGYLSNAWYAHDTTIAQLAQRIDPAGTNGAFYFHRQTAPEIKSVIVKKGGANATVYSTPLFRLV